MNLGINLEYLEKQRGTNELRPFGEAGALCKSAGFSLVDYSSKYWANDYVRVAEAERAILDKNGLSVGQTHAPINRYGQYDDETFWKLFRRSFEVSSILGAKYVVVHADEYKVTDHYDEAEILSFTYDYLAPCVDYAAKHGMVVAVENLFEDHCGQSVDGRSRFTSRIEELQAVIERFNTPTVKCCWDFGRARCAFGDRQLDALRRVGAYLVCTHVHDNYYGSDLHLLPFLGDIDWEAHMRYLSEIRYPGDLSLELVYGRMPDSLLPECLTLARRVGETLLAMGE